VKPGSSRWLDQIKPHPGATRPVRFSAEKGCPHFAGVEMFLSILLLSCSAVLGRFSGPAGIPDNSRFGGINSRLGRRKFPFTSRREFSHNSLI
jgi:hypothetical protein